MAGEIQLNTKQDPIFIPGPGASPLKPGFIMGIVVADTSFVTGAAGALIAAAVPQYTFAIVLTTKQIFVTEDNLTWQAYS